VFATNYGLGTAKRGKNVTKKFRPLVSLGMLSWLALRTDWDQVGKVFLHLRLELWFTALGLFLLAQVASAARWHLFARPLGFQNPLRQFICLYFVGMFFNLLLPTSIGGDVVRAWYLDGAPGRRLPAFLSVFVDRLSGLLILLALACVADVLCPIALPRWIGASVWATAASAVLGLVLVPTVGRCMNARESERVEPPPPSAERPYGGSWAPRSALRGLSSRLSALTLSLSQSLTLLFGRARLLLGTTVLSLLVQGVNVMILWLIGRAIDAPIPASYCGIVVPMVTLLTLLPVSLNGMGVREGGVVLFLAPLGISSATALSLALLWFSVFVAASLLGAAIYLWGSFSQPGEGADGPFIGRDSDQGRTRQFEAAA
jgi:glycosyltransferase 2 family protein